MPICNPWIRQQEVRHKVTRNFLPWNWRLHLCSQACVFPKLHHQVFFSFTKCYISHDFLIWEPPSITTLIWLSEIYFMHKVSLSFRSTALKHFHCTNLNLQVVGNFFWINQRLIADIFLALESVLVKLAIMSPSNVQLPHSQRKQKNFVQPRCKSIKTAIIFKSLQTFQ
jgi:hypothetical protein